MIYMAWVKDKKTGERIIIKSDFESKTEFVSELRSNGYAVSFATTEENFDRDSQKWHDAKERRNNINKIVREAKKENRQMKNRG